MSLHLFDLDFATFVFSAPQQIELNVDGNDPCSKGEDLNFKFSGFTVSGNVR